MTFNEAQATAIKIELQNHSHEVKNQEKSENMNLGEKNITSHVRAELRNKDKEQNMMTPTKLNEIDESFFNKTVTTKELANTLGVSSDSILLAVKRLNLTEKIRQVPINGKMGYVFNEAQATAIKIELQNHSKSGFKVIQPLDINVEGY